MAEPSTLTMNTNVLIAVTSFFNEHRLAYLAQTLRALSLWDVAYMRIVVLTNDAGQLNNTRLRRLWKAPVCQASPSSLFSTTAPGSFTTLPRFA